MLSIVIHEFANAVTMISPLICWFRQRCRHSTKKIHKLMVYHIPVSFAYHLSGAFPCLYRFAFLRRVLKAADLIFIHVISMVAAREVRIVKPKPFEFAIPKALNVVCMHRIACGNEDTMLRVASLYSCALYALKGYAWHQVLRLALTGSVACALFLLDDNLYSFGHSSFHIILGVFQNQIFDIIQPDTNSLGECYTT